MNFSSPWISAFEFLGQTDKVNPNVALIWAIINEGMRGAVFITTQMLDAGYLMLDIQECSNSEIQKYQVSSDQDPGSANADHDFRRNNSD